MSQLTVVKITHSSPIDAEINQADKYQTVASLVNLFDGMRAGASKGMSFDLQVAEGSAVAASGTVTFSGTGAANDTILINGVTLTAVAGAPAADQWQVGGTATISAINLKNAINASASALIANLVSATSALGVVTITAKNKGYAGNSITIAEGVDFNGHMSESGARLTAGADASANSYSFV